MNLWLIFLTGLTTGGLSCLAVQGGLLAGVIANQKHIQFQKTSKEEKDLRKQAYLEKLKNQETNRFLSSIGSADFMPVGMFLLAKLISHIILGFLLGALGSVLELSLGAKLTFQALTAIFMAATAANLLNLHPIFRYVSFTPPAFVRRWIKSTGKSQELFAPFILGLMTIFIPCGVTQAMEVLVISNGNAVQGALIMAAFVLGTMPLFTLIGIATAKLSESWHKTFTKVAAYALILMAIYSFNGVLQAANAPLSFQKLLLTYQKLQQYEKKSGNSGNVVQEIDGVQKVTINVGQSGYSPKRFKVKAGTPVELTLETKGVYTCASAFTFRAFDIFANLKPTDKKSFTFTPEKKGQFTFSCSMGMYTGVMEVI